MNALFGIQVAALGEILGVLQENGITVKQAVDILNNLPTTSPALKGAGTLIATRSFAPQFPIQLVEKDFKEPLTWTPPVCQVKPINKQESIAVLHPACSWRYSPGLYDIC